MVVDNSFGRDWANILLESRCAKNIEISYCTIDQLPERLNRVEGADLIFLTRDDITVQYVERFLNICLNNQAVREKLYVIGDKRFGVSNGIFYKNRWKDSYYNQTVKVPSYIIKDNMEKNL